MGRIAEGKTPTLAQVRPHHFAMAREQVRFGLRPGELAKMFKYTPTQITIITNSPLYMAEVARLESLVEVDMIDVRTELEMRQGLAIDAIDRGLVQPDANKAASVGFEVLDRTGYGKASEPQKHVHLHAHAEIEAMSSEDLQREAMRLVDEGGSS